MINNILVRWWPFRGYFVYCGGKHTYHLKSANINFYDKNGRIVTIGLDYGCSFYIPTENVEVNVRKEVSFFRHEIFIIKHAKRSKYDERTNVDIYIPMDAVGLKVGKTYEVEQDLYIHTMCDISIKANYFSTYNNQAHKNINPNRKKDRLIFSTFVGSKATDDWESTCQIAEDINTTCGLSVSAYDVRTILKHYDIVKKTE